MLTWADDKIRFNYRLGFDDQIGYYPKLDLKLNVFDEPKLNDTVKQNQILNLTRLTNQRAMFQFAFKEEQTYEHCDTNDPSCKESRVDSEYYCYMDGVKVET